MDTRFVESLLLVINTGSITQAAKIQAITPAALSGRIKTLEQQLGCELLIRQAKEVRPSKICLAMQDQFEQLVQNSNHLAKFALGAEGENEINIGCISTALTQYMPKLIKHIKRHKPNAQIFIKPGSSEQLYQYLQNHEIDCAITTKPNFKLPKAIYCTQVETQEVMLISKNPVAKPIESIFKRYPFIAYDQHSWGGSIIAQWLQKQDFEINMLCELDSLETIAQLVDEDLGFAIIPKWRGLRDLKIKIHMQSINHFTSAGLNRHLTFMRHNDPQISTILKLAEQAAKSQ